jgi:hypothetical protein
LHNFTSISRYINKTSPKNKVKGQANACPTIVFGDGYAEYVKLRDQSIIWHISESLPSEPNTPLETPAEMQAILTDLEERHQQAFDN